MSNGTENTNQKVERMILDALDILNEKRLMDEEEKALSSKVMTTVITRAQLSATAGDKIDQMDCMMNVAFIMGFIKAKTSPVKPKLSLAPEKKTELWDCDRDKEYLRHSDMDEAIEAYLDGQEIFPETVTVYGFSRKLVDHKSLVKNVLESAQEHLDEYYSGEDGHDQNAEVEKAAEEFASVYIENFTAWQCEESESIEINAMEWVEKNRPDWLKKE